MPAISDPEAADMHGDTSPSQTHDRADDIHAEMRFIRIGDLSC